jgi:hypothetical protein
MNKSTTGRLAALIATAAVAAGCGASGGQSNTIHASGTEGHARGGPSTVSRVQATHASGSEARTSVGPSIESRSKPPVIAAGPLLATVSGTGSEAIGALTEKTSVVLEWKTTSPPMQIFNGHGFLLLVSNLPSGKVRLAKGHYGDLHVGAKGPWTIQVHASA